MGAWNLFAALGVPLLVLVAGFLATKILTLAKQMTVVHDMALVKDAEGRPLMYCQDWGSMLAMLELHVSREDKSLSDLKALVRTGLTRQGELLAHKDELEKLEGHLVQIHSKLGALLMSLERVQHACGVKGGDL